VSFHKPDSLLDDRAAFIAGQGKSGTTLLLSLLDGHPQLLSFPEETAYFPTVLTKYRHAGRAAQAAYLTETAESRLLFSRNVRGGGRDYSHFPVEEMSRHFHAMWNAPDNAERDLLALLMEAYARTLGIPLEGIRRWIEKTPANRNHIPTIRSRFPHAKIILTLRDPRGVFDARLKRERAKKTPRLSLFDNIRNWRTAAENALLYKDEPDCHLVRFEELLHEPERVMRTLARFLDIDFLPVLLDPTKAGNTWTGNSAAKTGFSGINPAPCDRWRTGLTLDEIGWIERHCADLMVRLNYPLVGGRPGAWWRPLPGESLRSYLRSRWKSACFLLKAGART
jgi:hypothetical protein